MMPLTASRHLATAHLVLSGLVLLWDLYVASRVAKLDTTPRALAFVSALCALLLVPALTVLAASTSLISGRTVAAIAWLWPFTLALVAVQAIYASARRMVSPAIGIPIAIYDVLLAVAALARYAMSVGLVVGAPLAALVAAERGALAATVQPLALVMPWFVYLPMLAPAVPTRRGTGTVLRAALAALALAWGALLVVHVPRALGAVTSYARYAGEQLEERPDSEFTIGVKIFPTLTESPTPLSIESDLALADSVGAEALSIYIAPRGASDAVLDSVAHALEGERGDKVLIAALDLSGAPHLAPRARASYLRARMGDVVRIARRLHPDYVVPVIDPNGAVARSLGELSTAAWAAYLRDAAVAVHRVDPHIRVMAHVGSFGARDSALYAWAAAPASPVDAISFSLFPSVRGADALDAQMNAADAWLRASASSDPPAAVGPKERWVLETGGFPLAHGEAAQANAIWGVLAWASNRPAINGVIVFEASDYASPVGLRAAGGRLRRAATTVRRAALLLSGGS